MVTVDSSGLFMVHRLMEVRNQQQVYHSREIIPSPGRLLQSMGLNSGLFGFTKDGRFLVSGGHWDNSVRVTNVEQSSTSYVQSLLYHKGRVTCLSLTEDEGSTFLVTGSEDTTILIWELRWRDKKPQMIFEVPRHVLYGHNDQITAVVANAELGVVLSTSLGVVVVHDLRKGEYLRKVMINFSGKKELEGGPVLSLLALDPKFTGNFVVYSKSTSTLYSYSINGVCLSIKDVAETINAMFITKDGKYLITGGMHGSIVIRNLHDLESVSAIKNQTPVYSLCMAGQACLIAGMAGEFCLFHSKLGQTREKESLMALRRVF